MDIKVNLTNIVLKTERLVLRPWRDTDLSDFYAYASQPGVGEMAGWPHHRSMSSTRKVLDSFIKQKTEFAIVHRRESKVIGSIGLHASWANEDGRYRHLKGKDIGYVLSKDHWGQGLTPEAVMAVIDYCFAELGIEALTCGHFIENIRSRRVIEKCGFAFVMECEYYAKQLRRYFNAARYILIR